MRFPGKYYRRLNRRSKLRRVQDGEGNQSWDCRTCGCRQDNPDRTAFIYLWQHPCAGRIEDGNTQTDWLAVERERGISVRASSAELAYGGKRINLIDTPGHTDFASEVERAVSVLDAAVLVVSAADGIQGQTRMLWRALDTLQIPVLFFINKADQPGSDTDTVLGELKREFGASLVQMNELEGERDKSCKSIIRVLTDERIVLTAAENDDVLAEKYLSGEEVTREEVLVALTVQVLQRTLFPVVLGRGSAGDRRFLSTGHAYRYPARRGACRSGRTIRHDLPAGARPNDGEGFPCTAV